MKPACELVSRVAALTVCGVSRAAGTLTVPEKQHNELHDAVQMTPERVSAAASVCDGTRRAE